VLVVDNLPVNIQVLRGMLEPSGYQVASATDVKEAMATLRMNPPDLIVSDVHMPGLSGYDFIRSVKADSRLRNIPFMFVSSAYLTDDDRTLALTLGADKFVSRPMEPQVGSAGLSYGRGGTKTLNGFEELLGLDGF
jgi:two-component system cell cycle response regulator